MALLMMDEEEENKKHFNYNKIVEHQNLSKKKKKQLMKKKELLEDDFEVTGTKVISPLKLVLNLKSALEMSIELKQPKLAWNDLGRACSGAKLPTIFQSKIASSSQGGSDHCLVEHQMKYWLVFWL